MLAMTSVSGVVVVVAAHSGQVPHSRLLLGTGAAVGIVTPTSVTPVVPPSATRTPTATSPLVSAQPVVVPTAGARPRATTAPPVPRPVTTTRAPVAAPSPKPSPKASPTPAAAKAVVVNGAPADTRYGPVQVQITVQGRRITKADAIDYPNGDRRDQEINSYAIPQLDQETLQAQSAQIDTVSGATYTSDGYRTSLQSAIDAAHQAGVF